MARLVRTVFAIGASVLVMSVVLVGAIRYLQRDWNAKNQRARSRGGAAGHIHATASSDASTMPEDADAVAEHPYSIPVEARARFLSSLSGNGTLSHVWLLQGEAPGLDEAARRRAMMLDLAENGDSVQFRNLHAALLLKRGDVLQAVRQLRIADRMGAGHPPTIFNRALCAMMSGLPEQSTAWIVRYRARFPHDEQAMRFHFNLLLQTDRPEEAMEQMDRFLAGQPPEQTLYLDAAVQAARMGRIRDAIGYLETARRGQPPAVIARIYQSPAFREIRLSAEGTAFAGRLARQARAVLAATPAGNAAVSAGNVPARLPVDPKFH